MDGIMLHSHRHPVTVKEQTVAIGLCLQLGRADLRNKLMRRWTETKKRLSVESDEHTTLMLYVGVRSQRTYLAQWRTGDIVLHVDGVGGTLDAISGQELTEVLRRPLSSILWPA